MASMCSAYSCSIHCECESRMYGGIFILINFHDIHHGTFARDRVLITSDKLFINVTIKLVNCVAFCTCSQRSQYVLDNHIPVGYFGIILPSCSCLLHPVSPVENCVLIGLSSASMKFTKKKIYLLLQGTKRTSVLIIMLALTLL